MQEKIAVTGRVQAWLDNPEKKLPVSCTVFVVDDTFDETNEGLDASFRFVSHALRNAAGVAVHLSKLRPKGSTNSAGLVASGPVSFAKIYSVLNEVIRRGGTYKGGACVVTLDANHADLEEFIDAPRHELPWVKKCIQINQEWWDEIAEPVRQKLYKAIQSGDMWLSKVKYDQQGERIFSNVCLEVWIQSRGTCLLSHINMGACELGDLFTTFTNGMSRLCDLHKRTGVGETGEYLSPEVDRQVGLGLLGLANFLHRQGVSYAAFGEALSLIHDTDAVRTPALVLAREFACAVAGAASVARANNMDRAFVIAPTASCSYKYTDLDGFTTCPEIAPPISRQVDRDSGTFGVQSYDYGDVEIASEVGWHAFRSVADGICKVFADTGLFHGYSFNSWSDVVTYDQAFIEDWLASPQTSLYYALQVAPDTLRKDDVTSILDEDYHDIFGFETEEEFCSSCAE